MDYCFNGGCWGTVFAVPQSVVDNYIKLADESALKVLLYALRNSGRSFSDEEIAAALNISVQQVEKAFVFWENANVFSKSAELQTTAVTAEAPVPTEKKIKKSSIPKGTSYNLKPTEIAERVSGSEEVKVMFSMAEASFGRPLNHTEQRSFIWMHDYLGLSADVLITIAAYCISIEKPSVKYIETLAYDWSEKGINTLELVQEEIKSQEESRSFNGRIIKMFGMKRKPTSKQQEFIDLWKEKAYSLELIEYAYEKTVEQIEKLNFPYINRILENWQEKGILTKEQADSEKSAKKREFEKTSEHSYNLDDYKSLVNNFGGNK